MTDRSRTVWPGSPAPPLRGPTAGGAYFDLAALRPRSVVVEFHRGTW